MRIGMMTDNYTSHISGVTNHISLCKRFLELEGHEVYVFSFDKAGVVSEEENVILTLGIPIADFHINFLYSQQAQRLLSSMDVVHVHHPFISGLLAKRYCKPLNIPIVFTNHTRYDLYAQAYFPLLPKSVSDGSLKAFLSQFYSDCDLVIVPSDSLHQILVNNFGLDSPTVVIPNGVDLDPLCKDNLPVDREIFGCSKDNIIAIYVGRLSPEKNLLFLLEAFQKAAIFTPQIRLLLVGDGPERKKLEGKAKQLGIDSIAFFIGMIPYKDVPHYLAASDLFISASCSEVFPLSTIEAIGAGLPVLAVNAPGNRDIIEDGITGLLSTDDINIFVEQLKQLSTNHTLRQKLGKQALESSKKYDIRITTNDLIREYGLLVDKAKNLKKGIQSKPSHLPVRSI